MSTTEMIYDEGLGVLRHRYNHEQQARTQDRSDTQRADQDRDRSRHTGGRER